MSLALAVMSPNSLAFAPFLKNNRFAFVCIFIENQHLRPLLLLNTACSLCELFFEQIHNIQNINI